MRTSGEIRFDFQNAMSQAKKLDDIASTIERRVASGMENAEQGVHTAWTGNSATCYIGKAERLRVHIQRTARELRETAADIRRIARRMYAAEMRALEIAQRRNS